MKEMDWEYLEFNQLMEIKKNFDSVHSVLRTKFAMLKMNPNTSHQNEESPKFKHLSQSTQFFNKLYNQHQTEPFAFKSQRVHSINQKSEVVNTIEKNDEVYKRKSVTQLSPQQLKHLHQEYENDHPKPKGIKSLFQKFNINKEERIDERFNSQQTQKIFLPTKFGTEHHEDTEIKENFNQLTQSINSTFPKHYYTQKSLNWIPINNFVRIICIKLIEWNRFEHISIFVIIINSIFLGIADYTNPKSDQLSNQLASQSEPIFAALFTLECIIKIVAMGFIFDRNCYLRDPWNWLDFIVVITAIIGLFPGIGSVSGLRTFRLFRPLRSLSTVSSMEILINTLLQSFIQFGHLTLLALFFFGVFAILGINLFGGLMDQRCRQTPYPVDGNWLVVEGDTRICGKGGLHNCSIACGSLHDYPSSILYNVTSFDRDAEISQLNWGITNFNYIWNSLLTVFQCATVEGWTKLVYIIGDAYNFIFTAVFFTTLIVICNFFLLNLTVAVMLQQFTNQQDINQKLVAQIEKQYGPENVEQLLKLKENRQRNYQKTIRPTTESTFNMRLYLRQAYQFLIYKKIEVPQTPYYKYRITKYCYIAINQQWVQSVLSMMIFINTIVLCFDKYPYPANQQLFYGINKAFTYLFILEVFIKLIGLGHKEFFSDKFNLFDFFVILLTIAQIGVQTAYDTEGSSGTAIIALRAFRLMKLLKFLIKWDSLKLLFESITHTVSAIGNFTILLFLFVYVYSLLGMQFFAGKLKFNAQGEVDHEDGVSPRANFDSLLWAFVTVFQVLIGDGWNDVMYSCIRAVGYGSTVYFVTLVVFGNIIMLNLFLAIIIGNFEEASILMAEMKQVEENYQCFLQRGNTIGQYFGDVQYVEQSTITNNKKGDKVTPRQNVKSNQIYNLSFQQRDSSLKDQSKSNVSPRKDLNFDQIVEEDEKQESDMEDEENMDQERRQEIENKNREANDSSYDSSFTQIDINYMTTIRQKNTLRNNNNTQDLADSKRASDSFDANVFVNQMKIPERLTLEYKKDARSAQMQEERQSKGKNEVQILVEDAEQHPKIEFKNRNFPSKSVIIGSPQKGTDSLQLEVSPAHHHQGIHKHIQGTNIDLSQGLSSKERGELESESKKSPSNRRSIRQSKTINQSLSAKKLAQLQQIARNATKSQNAFKSLQIYKEKGNFYKFFNYITRSSLFLLHKRSWIRIQLIKLVIPIKQKTLKQVKQGEGIKQVDEIEQLHMILDSDASSEEDFNEYGEEYLDQSDLLDQYNEQTPKDNNGTTFQKEEISNSQRSFQKGISRGMTSQTLEFQRGLVDTSKSQLQTTASKRQKRRLTKRGSKATNESHKKKINQKSINCCNTSISSQNKIFENAVLALIVLSSLVLILDNPLNNPNETFSDVIKLIDYSITFLFVIEALIKILAFGLFSTSLKNQKAYLFVGWNLLDLFVVTASIIDFSYSPIIDFNNNTQKISNKQSLKSLKALRALRALRPLKVISKNEGLKLVVNALFSSLPALFNVMIMNALFILIFAIIGVNFFKGTFYYCNLSNTFNQVLIDTKFDCINYGGDWINGKANFDNLQQAALTLFQLMTCQGWLEISYQGVDARWIFYFIFFIIIGSMFFVNLFVGVVIVNFNRMKEKLCGFVNLTEDQRKWIEMQRYMIRLKLILKKEKSASAIQGCFLRIVNNQAFDIMIMIVIIINTIFMSMKYNSMPIQYSNALDIANYIFTAIFNIECIMKILAFHKLYFFNYWNIFDFIVVIGANLGLIFKFINTQTNIATAAIIIRSFRIIRIFRLIKASQNMKVLIDTLLHILPSLLNVGALILLMLFIYAALGINLFATVMFQTYVNEYNNFQTFGMALLALFRCATGENWNNIMNELASSNPNCIDNQTYEAIMLEGVKGCGTKISYLFFTSYIISVQMIIMNLFIAVVIEGFCSSTNENTGPVTSENYNQLLEKWADYDNNAIGWIDLNSLAFLVYELDYPLGRKNEYDEQLKQRLEQDQDQKKFKSFDYRSKYICNSEKNMILPQKAALKLMIDLELPVYNNHKVHFKDVCIKLTKDAIAKQGNQFITDFESMNELQKQRLERDWMKTFAGLRKYHKIPFQNDVYLNTKMFWAGSFILKILRIMRDNQRANRQKEFAPQAKKSSGIMKQIKKQKLEKKMQEQQEQMQLEDQMNEDKITLDNADYYGDENKMNNKLDTQQYLVDMPERKFSMASVKPEIDKKVKDTERSTWWKSKSSRMEKWLVNQERRQIKKKNQIQPQQTSQRQIQKDAKASQLTFYPSTLSPFNDRQMTHKSDDIELQVPTAKFAESHEIVSPDKIKSLKKQMFQADQSIKSVSSSSSGCSSPNYPGAKEMQEQSQKEESDIES